MMARAATSPELAKLRGLGQSSQLFLAIRTPTTVFAARVNQSFETTDDVSEVTYDGGTGTLASVLPGMTCYVGSSAGAYDLGMVRIRKAPSATVFYIGRTSEIEWADNYYLTVVDEFELWAKHWYEPDEDHVYMDQDLAYTDQNANLDPVPVLGPDAVLDLDGPGGGTLNLSAAGSWVLGSTISGYSWSAPGAGSSSGMLTATPSVTYNSAGQYRISCTVTAANGKSSTGYRRVFVFSAANMPTRDFTLESCSGDRESGSWSFSVTLFDQASFSDVRDRAKVILFAKDVYNGVAGSIGPVAGYENIVCAGWIDGETIAWDPQQGSVRFTVRGPVYWLSRLAAYSGGLKSTTSAPADWLHIQSLTVDKALWNLLHWRSTATAILDVYLSGDTRTASGLVAPAGTLGSQIKDIASRIVAEARSDRFGRLFVEADAQFIPVASRAAIPVVQAITTADFREAVRIGRKETRELAQVETGGVGATESQLYFSRSKGKIPGLFGSIEQRSNWLVTDQADLNARTGLLYAQRNNPYPSITIPLVGIHRLVDICPRQYLTLTLAAGETPRGLVWTAKRIIPRRVEFRHDAKSGVFQVDLDCEGETSSLPGNTVIPPAIPTINIPVVPPIPTFPPMPFLPPIPGNPPIISLDCADDPYARGNGPFPLGFAPQTIYEGESAVAMFPCSVRQMGSWFPTRLYLYADYGDDAKAHYSIAAVDGAGSIVVAGSLAGFQPTGYSIWDFAPLAGTSVEGFKVSLAYGGVGAKAPGKILKSGTVAATDGDGAAIDGLIGLSWYCLEATGGPYHRDVVPPADDSISYSFVISLDGIHWTTGNGYDDLTETFKTTSGLQVDNLDGYHARVYFQAQGNAVYIRVEDDLFDDNGGTLGWVLRKANSARKISINSGVLYNVCDP